MSEQGKRDEELARRAHELEIAGARDPQDVARKLGVSERKARAAIIRGREIATAEFPAQCIERARLARQLWEQVRAKLAAGEHVPTKLRRLAQVDYSLALQLARRVNPHLPPDWEPEAQAHDGTSAEEARP